MILQVLQNVSQCVVVLAYTLLVGLAPKVTETHYIMIF